MTGLTLSFSRFIRGETGELTDDTPTAQPIPTRCARAIKPDSKCTRAHTETTQNGSTNTATHTLALRFWCTEKAAASMRQPTFHLDVEKAHSE